MVKYELEENWVEGEEEVEEEQEGEGAEVDVRGRKAAIMKEVWAMILVRQCAGKV